MSQTEIKTELPYTSDGELLLKSVHLIYFRLAFAMISMVSAALWYLLVSDWESPLSIVFIALFVAIYGAVALFAIKNYRLQEGKLLSWLNAALIALDITSISLLVHFTHGSESDLYFLYLLPTVLASHICGRRGIFLTAFAASLAYVTTLLVGNLSFLPYLSSAQSPSHGLASAYSQRLWLRVLLRSAMLGGISFVWAYFCQDMAKVAEQGASRLRGQLAENSKLFVESQAHAAREQLINVVAAAVRSTLDINQILQATITQLGVSLRTDYCAIVIPGEHIGDPPAIWETQDPTTNQPMSVGGMAEFALERFAGNVIVDGEDNNTAFVFADALQEPFLQPIYKDLERLHLNLLIAQPIVYGSDVKGVILIGGYDGKRVWTDSDTDLSKAVAGQVALAIEHARLVEQLSRKNRDLLQKNLHLDSKNLELRTMQSQLVHQEKMASLGRMVAGIAHELNNPVNFVHGNVPYLRDYLKDLKEIIAAIDALPADSRAAVDKLKDKVRYDFLVTDLDNIVADLAEGADRIRQIIKNLRSFSRLDEAELKEASIQEGIESTIKILNQYYGRDKIQAKCDFADLPSVVCYPGKLNQVWMNLLSNAAQAVANVPEPVVSIRSELSGPWVIVSIADNGAGIKAQDESKIFEPFYTTKPVGQGTGLGLSICHSIIERHGGNIWFESAPGQGTTFKVKIPLKAEPEALEPVLKQSVLS